MINIITLDKDGVIVKNKLFTGKKALMKADLHFIQCLKNLNDSIEKQLIELALDKGSYTHKEITINISHPEVID